MHIRAIHVSPHNRNNDRNTFVLWRYLFLYGGCFGETSTLIDAAQPVDTTRVALGEINCLHRSPIFSPFPLAHILSYGHSFISFITYNTVVLDLLGPTKMFFSLIFLNAFLGLLDHIHFFVIFYVVHIMSISRYQRGSKDTLADVYEN